MWLLTEACKDAQLWHEILEACNQKLESSKCKYHAIHFNFDEEGAPTMALDAVTPHPILVVVTDGEGHQLEMKHQPSNVEIKYLGCFKAPNSNCRQLQAITAKCNTFARIANTSSLTSDGLQCPRSLAWLQRSLGGEWLPRPSVRDILEG